MSEKQKAFEKWWLDVRHPPDDETKKAWRSGWSAHARVSVPLSKVLKILDGLGCSGMARIDARAWADNLRKAHRPKKRKSHRTNQS